MMDEYEVKMFDHMLVGHDWTLSILKDSIKIYSKWGIITCNISDINISCLAETYILLHITSKQMLIYLNLYGSREFQDHKPPSAMVESLIEFTMNRNMNEITEFLERNDVEYEFW